VHLSQDDTAALAELDARLKLLLPPAYADSYETLSAAPMKSAGLKFDGNGEVAWNEIWGSFCDLALAGGPPHKGALLGPASAAEVDAHPDQYDRVVREVCRGVEMVTSLPCEPAETPGWVRVECYSATMASWLLRAIVTENVAARAAGVRLDLPVAPSFLLEKEIKNIVTVSAKTCHYWLEHMPRAQQRAIAELLASLDRVCPLVTPLEPVTGWMAVECVNASTAIWMMRALVAQNVLARREGHTLFVPVNPEIDPGSVRVRSAVARVQRLAARPTQSPH
jgi:sirohydrochlorin cobaltochelatase